MVAGAEVGGLGMGIFFLRRMGLMGINSIIWARGIDRLSGGSRERGDV